MSANPASIIIRPETAADIPAIEKVIHKAFGAEEEVRLMASLRNSPDLLLSLVAERDGALCGHVAFCRVDIRAPDGRETPAACLAPLAVAPAFQRRGIGAALVETGLKSMESAGEAIVFLLGEPGYYSRFGFSTIAAKPFRSPFSRRAGAAHMARILKPGALVQTSGELRYPPPFSAFI